MGKTSNDYWITSPGTSYHKVDWISTSIINCNYDHPSSSPDTLDGEAMITKLILHVKSVGFQVVSDVSIQFTAKTCA